MRTLTRTVFALLYATLLFLLPLTLLIYLHTFLYPSWVVYSGYTSDHYSYTELITSQNVLAGALFERPLTNVNLTERERIHIEDVVDVTVAISLVTLGILIGMAFVSESRVHRFVFTTRYFRMTLSLFYGVLLLMIAIGVTGFFDSLFLKFHLLVFNNNFWQLYATDLLINVYSPIFFQHMIFLLLTLSLIFYIITITFSYSLEKKYGFKN